MPTFTAEELRIGYRLASGDTVTYVSTYKDARGELLVQVTAQNGTKSVYEYPADAEFFDVDTKFYDTFKEEAK